MGQLASRGLPGAADRAGDRPQTANRAAVELLVSEGVVDDGDLVIVTKGDLMGIRGGTNQLKILRVGEHHNG
ncbi:MAG: pyruvate kinase alpha/beta domain-containing protein [Thiolinea sp.]